VIVIQPAFQLAPFDPGVTGRLNCATDTGFTHEHMARFFGQHKAAGAAERIEPGLRQGFELHFAITISEIGEHEERQPIRRLFVEGTQ